MTTSPYDLDLDRNPGQFPAADAADPARARGAGLSRPVGDRPRAAAAQLSPSSTPARAGSARRSPSAASSAATRSPSCSPTRRRCSSATTACRCAARCSTPSTPGSTRRRSPSCSITARPRRCSSTASSPPSSPAALKLAKVRPLIVDYDDPEYDGPGERLGALDYEALLAEGDPDYQWVRPRDEWDAISLNYTSGTTGDPKGVVYHHRGANLLAVGNVVTADMGRHPVYLWTLPMFHCNGWCFPWSISVKAGVHVCLRQVRAKAMYDLIAEHGVTHLCGAPIVMSVLLNAPPGREAAAAPSGALLHRRRAAARRGAGGDARSRLRGDPSLWPHRDLRPGGGQRLEGRVERARRRPPRRR